MRVSSSPNGNSNATYVRVGVATSLVLVFGLSVVLSFLTESERDGSSELPSAGVLDGVGPKSDASEGVANTPAPQEPEPIPSGPREDRESDSQEEVAKSPDRANGAEDQEFLQKLEGLVIAEEQRTGYNRDLFSHWVDTDGDGCDARREVLIAESIDALQVGAGCSIAGGYWISVYDGRTTRNPSEFDVDHFVPLAEAWDSGANRWDSSTRREFANDLGYEMSLIAVSASSNRSKGADDPTSWMPANADYWCEYIYAWVNVKHRWSLSVDSAERKHLEKYWSGCTVTELDFSASAVKVTVVEAESPPAPTPSPEEDIEPEPTPGIDPRYRTCRDAIASGYGDYIRGVDPEYRWYRDADSDGIVCER